MNASHELDCNVYLLDRDTAQAVIDCGTGYGVLASLAELARDGFATGNVSTVLLTHAHQDHAGGASQWRHATGAAIAASTETAAIIEAGDEEANGLFGGRLAGIYPMDCRLDACKVDIRLVHGEYITIGDLTLEAIATPGHSSDMMSYIVPGAEGAVQRRHRLCGWPDRFLTNNRLLDRRSGRIRAASVPL
ncbi:MBL fold metallo-hydrolase [Paenibacillus nasutitermitis]|uniref:MBL fold metallo-hydrolase n=1 Tax=Paenibacillus nasutitermitis TaxID=1652958 RepID=UPI00166B1EFE|nr:MBL fold metallo-hydrolase [Paenibacillus nasutitermitis]